jgi:periplasmic divalent cation tolerance protein
VKTAPQSLDPARARRQYAAPVTDLLRVTTATPDLDSAKTLARTAVAARLAGNAQITGPVISVFWHLGESGEGEEYAVTLSTTAAAFPALEAHLREHHPWDNPEITAIELTAAPEAYARWLRESTTPQG